MAISSPRLEGTPHSPLPLVLALGMPAMCLLSPIPVSSFQPAPFVAAEGVLHCAA